LADQVAVHLGVDDFQGWYPVWGRDSHRSASEDVPGEEPGARPVQRQPAVHWVLQVGCRCCQQPAAHWPVDPFVAGWVVEVATVVGRGRGRRSSARYLAQTPKGAVVCRAAELEIQPAGLQVWMPPPWALSRPREGKLASSLQRVQVLSAPQVRA
jgi:hypothetical protein